MNLLHAGNTGDVIAALPAVRELARKKGKPMCLFLEQDRPAFYYEGATHPVQNAEGQLVSLNAYMIGLLVPLLEAQPYIELAKKWEGEEIDVDLSAIRTTFVGAPYGNLSRWYFMAIPDSACDLSVPFLSVPPSQKDLAKGKIIINRSERYTNETIDYSFLKEYQDDLLFVGTDKEHILFLTTFDLDFPRLEVADFLELAQAVDQCRFCIGNQSSPFQIYQGLMKPRILEVCHYAPNVQVVGENAFDFFHQVGLVYYVQYLHHLTIGSTSPFVYKPTQS